MNNLTSAKIQRQPEPVLGLPRKGFDWNLFGTLPAEESKGLFRDSSFLALETSDANPPVYRSLCHTQIKNKVLGLEAAKELGAPAKPPQPG